MNEYSVEFWDLPVILSIGFAIIFGVQLYRWNRSDRVK